jgi:uncharacterized membrane protein YheB (UPF0754 family)
MLFHPRQPVYIGGIRLPLTPGLVPLEQKRIAQAIGESMTYLIKPDRLRSEITDRQVLFSIWLAFEQELKRYKVDIVLPQKIRLKLFKHIMRKVLYRLPAIVDSLQLPKTVEREVANYSPEMLESLIVKVADRELKAITAFGAVLGAIIGVLQYLLQSFLV